MKLKNLIFLFIFLELIGFLIVPSFSQPLLPHFFYGEVRIITSKGEIEAKDGTPIYAFIGEEVKGVTTVNKTRKWDYYLVVSDGKNGDLIKFKIGDRWADQTYTFISGGNTNLNLTVTLKERPAYPTRSTPSVSCTENWICSEWSPCYPNGTQYRNCTDLNRCGTTRNKPVEIQNCTYIPPTYCGDGICQSDENCSSCEIDCGRCPGIPLCGNNICEEDENCSTCPEDCGICSNETAITSAPQTKPSGLIGITGAIIGSVKSPTLRALIIVIIISVVIVIFRKYFYIEIEKREKKKRKR